MSIPVSALSGGVAAFAVWYFGGSHNLQISAMLVTNAAALALWEVI